MTEKQRLADVLSAKHVKRGSAAVGPDMTLKVLNYSEFGFNKHGFFFSSDPRTILEKIN